MMRRFITPVLAFLILAPATAYAQDDVVRRIAAASSIALVEYQIGVVDGSVVNQDEYAEAALFLSQGAEAADGITDGAVRVVAQAYLDTLSSGVERTADAALLKAVLERFRERLESLSGVALDQYPDTAPSLAEGANLFAASCTQCHGALGAGDGPAAAGLTPEPADLTDRAGLSDVSPLDFFRVLSAGVAGTAMRAYTEEFSVEQRWALALYASTLRNRDIPVRSGESILRRECPECLVQLSGLEYSAAISDDSMAVLLGAQQGISAASELEPAVAFARVAAASEELGGDRLLAFERVIGRTKVLLQGAAAAAIAGNADAGMQGAVDAYLVFEQVEASVRATASAAAGDIEAGFADLRSAIPTGDTRLITSRATALDAALGRSVRIIAATSNPRVLFGKSLLIILREGLEAILIVGALTAFLFKAGAPERRKDIGLGVGAAVAASFATAFLFATAFDRALESREMLEGLIMLVAASVLFWVSYWLVSKIEMRRWQEFVRNSMGRALSSRSRFALAAVAFLAVYREGFETVLFYAALYASADGATSGVAGITAGLVAGMVALVAVYVAIQKYGVKIPLKPFFAGTSALLYLMAFSFVGQGIAELQASGSVGITPLTWVPTVPMLGIFPTMQTITLQSLMALAVALALAWVFWLSPRYAEARVRS